MSSLLARLGHWEVRRTVHSLRTPRRKSSPNERPAVECRAKVSKASNQRRSYGDDFRSPVPDTRTRVERAEPTASFEQKQHQQTTLPQQQQQELDHNPAELPGRVAYDPNAVFAETTPPYPAQDARPSARTDSAAREPDIKNARSPENVEQLELWEQFERGDSSDDAVEGEARRNVTADVDAPAHPTFRPIEANIMLDINYRAELPFALLKNEADMVVRCLFAAIHVNDREFLREIPATTFSEIIRVLEPRHFMSPLASAHLELSAAMARQLGIAPMREVAYEYVSCLKEVISVRRGIRLTLSDFKILLRSARDLGHQQFAFMLWNVLWIDGHIPDTKCYNLYMSSAVWNGIHSAGARHKIRVIDFNMMSRRKERPKNRFHHYRVGPGGVKETAMKIFNEMLSNGAVADEESFRILISATAREGDIATAKSILKKVWNIDVDALIAGQDETTITPRPLPTHSPLHPTPQLLFVIAQTFGMNNDIPSALRVVDFVARHYQLPITRAIWNQLFEWTFVLAIDRHGTNKADGSKAGQLPAESVMSLWNTMTSEPYSVQPTMGMYNFLIKNLFQRRLTPQIMEKMREGQELYFRDRKYAKKLWFDLQEQLAMGNQLRGSVEKLRHDWEAADLVRKRDLFWLKRWLRLLLGSYNHHFRVDQKTRSFAIELPGFLWEWRTYAPTTVRYETPTGMIEFQIRTDEEMEIFARKRFLHMSRRKAGLEGAERYVGERWTVGEVHVPKRIQVTELCHATSSG